MLKSSASALNKISQGQDGFKSIKSAVANLAGCVSQLIMAGTKDTGKENRTMDESVSKTPMKYNPFISI